MKKIILAILLLSAPFVAESQKTRGFPEQFPDQPNNIGSPVPIVESIIGLLGLGGAYAWRIAKKNKKEN